MIKGWEKKTKNLIKLKKPKILTKKKSNYGKKINELIRKPKKSGLVHFGFKSLKLIELDQTELVQPTFNPTIKG